MRESILLSQIAAATAGGFPGRPDILVGPGDDCAVIDSPAGDTLLLTVDQLIEGVHYRPGRPVDEIAAAAIGRAASDIAAMGGSPRFALAAAALHKSHQQQHATDLFNAMARRAEALGCPLVGGDLAITDAPTTLTVTVIGAPHPGRGPVLRSGAMPGDLVFVTGPLGAARASGWTLVPAPRLELAAQLCDALGGDLHAMIDISDGLGIDAARIAERSSVAIELDAARIPLALGVGSWTDAVASGEDYELCFTTSAPPPKSLGCVEVGRVTIGAGCRVATPDGESVDAGAMGWDHHA